MKVGIDVSQHQLEWREIRERVAWAEEAGFESAWVFDHFTALYGDRRGPCLEAWTLLAALAAVTTRIRLGALVTGVTYRHPSLLASEVVTVDHVSEGRLNVGLGAAWHGDEHRRLGFDFPPTGERTIWIGADGARVMLPLAARHADVWHGSGSVSELARKSTIVDRAAEAAGRDPAEIARSTSLSISEPWDVVRREAEQLRTAGFTHLIASWPSEGLGRVEEFAGVVMPELLG